MARESWPNALNAQLFNSKVRVYFVGVFRNRGLITVNSNVVQKPMFTNIYETKWPERRK